MSLFTLLGVFSSTISYELDHTNYSSLKVNDSEFSKGLVSSEKDLHIKTGLHRVGDKSQFICPSLTQRLRVIYTSMYVQVLSVSVWKEFRVGSQLSLENFINLVFMKSFINLCFPVGQNRYLVGFLMNELQESQGLLLSSVDRLLGNLTLIVQLCSFYTLQQLVTVCRTTTRR